VALAAAADGEEGLAQASACPPDLAVIGLSAPPLGGHEVARRLRAALGPAPFLVALSSYAEPEDLRQAREAGFDAYGWKPIGAEEARAWLQEAAARAQGLRVG
jgi:CheY-like chemotaxis protein